MNIADVFFKALLDDSQLSVDAKKAGDKAGTTMGGSMSGALKKGLAGAAIGGLFTTAVESGVKFEDQLRTINTVAKVSDAQLNQIGDSIQALSRMSGKTTDDLTSGFYDLVSAGVPADKAMQVLKDSAILATGALGTTGEAVDLVTGALGAWNLEASQSTRVTDIFAQAVADGKTTVADLSGGLSQVAPIAAAAGISLEEVAAQTTIMTLKNDTAAQAMTRIKNAISALLTPNATLAEITKRTGINFAELAKNKGLGVALEELRKATKGNNEEFAKALGSSEALTLAFSITGDNAGVMADELARIKGGADKGGVALEQYTEKSKSAAEQGKRLVAVVQTFLQDVGGPFVGAVGPAVFAINQMGGAFGKGGVAAKAFGAVLGGLSTRLLPALAKLELGTRLETLWIKGMTKIGDPLIASISGVWTRVATSPIVSGVVGRAGSLAATAYLKALIAGDAIGAVLSRAWAATGAKLVAAAAVEGSAAGTAFAVAAAAAIIAAPLAILYVELRIAEDVAKAKEGLAGQIDKVIQDGTRAGLERARGALQAQIDSQKILGLIPFQWAGEVDAMKAQLAKIDAALLALGPNVTDSAARLGPAINDGLDRAAVSVATSPAAKSITKGLSQDVMSAIKEAGMKWAKESRRQANLTAGAWGQGFRDRRDAVDQAWQDMLDGMKHPMSVTRETARLFGKLTSEALWKGMHSADPAVKDQAIYTKQLILDRLAELRPRVGTLTRGAMAELKRALHSADPDIRAAAQQIYNSVTRPVSKLPAAGRSYGSSFVKNIIAGMNSHQKALAAAAAGLAGIARDTFQLHSPAKIGPWSEGGGPEGWGRKFSVLLSRGINSLKPDYGAMSHLGDAVPNMAWSPRVSGLSAPALSPTAAGQPVVHLQTYGTPMYARTPFDIVTQAARGARLGVLTPKRRTAWSPNG